MSGPAQVRSTHAIEEFRAALAKFELRVQAALDGLDMQLRRAQEWIDYDRPSHWKRETRQAEKALHEAKLDLERCLMFPVADERPSCREERDEVKQCSARVEYCRGKSQRVQQWRRDLNHELLEYHGKIGQLRRLLELELPRARAALELILRQLAAYRLEQAPPAAADATSASAPQDRLSQSPTPHASQPSTQEE